MRENRSVQTYLAPLIDPLAMRSAAPRPGSCGVLSFDINGRHAHSRCANARTPVRQASAGDCAMCGYAPGEQGRYHGRLPLPRIEGVLHGLNGSRFFSRYDLKDAYHQLQLHPNPMSSSDGADLNSFGW